MSLASQAFEFAGLRFGRLPRFSAGNLFLRTPDAAAAVPASQYVGADGA